MGRGYSEGTNYALNDCVGGLRERDSSRTNSPDNFFLSTEHYGD